MKPISRVGRHVCPMSPPSRGRGLKLLGLVDPVRPLHVAPFTGAWIETCTRRLGSTALPSPPSRGRGLKRGQTCRKRFRPHVAPFTGAWIETSWPSGRPSGPSSPPSRGRGLKRLSTFRSAVARASPPSRGRGLKQGLPVRLERVGGVAPFTGAWIETYTTNVAMQRTL